MTQAELGAFLRATPTLFHMAERGSWPGIAQHGLRSTSALLDLFEVADREPLEARRRPQGVRLYHPSHGTCLVRDQKPISDLKLRRCLAPEMEVSDWYRLLNSRVFFWPSRDRLLALLCARPYRALEHDVLEVDTASLVDAYRDAVTLSPINSGSTLFVPVPRGPRTFLPIADWPAGRKVVELAVTDAVPDIARFVRRVVRMCGAVEVGVVYAPGRG